MANDVFLQNWEDADLAENGLPIFQRYARMLKEKQGGRHQLEFANGIQVHERCGPDPPTGQAAATRSWVLQHARRKQTAHGQSGPRSSLGQFHAAPECAGQTAGGKAVIAGMGLSGDAMADTIRSDKVGQTGHVYRVRADGNLLIQRDPALADGKHQLKDLPGLNEAFRKTLLTGNKSPMPVMRRRPASSSSPPPACRN